MKPSSAFWLAPLVLLLAVPSGVPSSPQPAVYLLHDVADDGYTYVGNVNHFGYILLDAEGHTTVHHQGRIVVTLNDVVLYETSLDAGHDYNVLNSLEVAFPAPGHYRVHAEVPLSGSNTATADFEGTVAPNPKPSPARLELSQNSLATTGGPTRFTLAILDASGALIPHTDADVEIRRPSDQWLVFRTHLHSHQEKMGFDYTFLEPGTYVVRAFGYNAFPRPSGPHLAPLEATLSVAVEPASLGVTLGESESLPDATGTPPYSLLTTVDPQDSNTPFSRFVLSALVFDPNANQFVPHVDFGAQVVDALGRVVFSSQTLHEYDGHLELVLNLVPPGRYVLKVSAAQDDWVQRVELPFTVLEVLPPGGTPLPSSPGALIVTADGLSDLKSGTPTAIQFQAQTAAGTPAMHSEIDFQILPSGDTIPASGWKQPILQNKIHTHDSGTFDVSVNFPEPGDYLLVVDPVTIHGDVTPHYYFGALRGALTVPLKVAFGTPFPSEVPVPAVPASAPSPPNALPGFGWGAVVALGLGALAWTRRLDL